MKMPFFHVDTLRSRYGGPYSLALSEGECVAVTGPSGSGKSVLLRLIADLDPHSGRVHLGGRDRSSWSAPEWRRRVVYQPAEPAWWAGTAAEHFEEGSHRLAKEMMGQIGLSEGLLQSDITRLSTGERQRMALIRSLARQPKILLLDEPTASLDSASTRAVETLLQERMHRDGLGILLVTHSLEQAARLANRHLQIRDGEIHNL